MLLSDEDRSDKQLICRQTNVIFQYIYKYNIPLRRGFGRLNLLRRQARNRFLPTNSVVLCSKHPFKDQNFGRFQERDCYTSSLRTTYIFSYDLSKKVKTFVWRNRTIIVYTILKFTMERVKLPHGNLLRHSLVRLSTKEFASWPSGSIKTTERPYTAFRQLPVYVDNEPNVVILIARWTVCYVHSKWRKIERLTIRYDKLEEYNPFHKIT